MKVILRQALCLWIALWPSTGPSAQAPFAVEPKQKAAVREAIFRYMFEHYTYGPSVKVYCIAAEKPLPDEFIRRFDRINRRVVWSYECDNSGPMNAVMHKKTHEHGLLMKILELQWQGGVEADARVEAFSDGIAANWNILRLTLRDGHWTVTSDKSDGVS